MKKIFLIISIILLLGCVVIVHENFDADNKSVLPSIYIESGKIGSDLSNATMKIVDDINDTPKEQLYDGVIEIKLRGNSTIYRAKHPYKIKLKEDANLFNMGSNKHWVLLANDLDHTQIRNQITLDFAREIGMDNASKSRLVSLFINDEYQGVYELAEQVRVDESRVDIYDWDDTFMYKIDGNSIVRHNEEIDTSVPQTGGFLLEGDYLRLENYLKDGEYDENKINNNDEMIDNIFTDWYMPLYFNTPEGVYPDTDLYQYTYNYIQSFEYALYSPDFIYHADDKHYKPANMKVFVDNDKGVNWTYDLKESDYHNEQFDGWKYDDFFDLDSLVNYFLINEITMNWDGMKNSLFLYKDIVGKAYIGPAWDYDWAYSNMNINNIEYMTDTWKNLDKRFFSENENFFYLSTQWYVQLCKNEEFLNAVYDKYWNIRNTAIQELIDSIYEYEDILEYDCKKNDELWGDRYSLRDYDENADYDNCFSDYTGMGYAEAYQFLEKFVNDRVNWLDEQMSSKDTSFDSINTSISLLQ